MFNAKCRFVGSPSSQRFITGGIIEKGTDNQGEHVGRGTAVEMQSEVSKRSVDRTETRTRKNKHRSASTKLTSHRKLCFSKLIPAFILALNTPRGHEGTSTYTKENGNVRVGSF